MQWSHDVHKQSHFANRKRACVGLCVFVHQRQVIESACLASVTRGRVELWYETKQGGSATCDGRRKCVRSENRGQKWQFVMRRIITATGHLAHHALRHVGTGFPVAIYLRILLCFFPIAAAILPLVCISLTRSSTRQLWTNLNSAARWQSS